MPLPNTIPLAAYSRHGRTQGSYLDPALPEAWYVAEYKFFDGDLYEDKNGFSWQGSKPIAAPPSEIEQGGRFTFTGNADPRVQPTSEQRYSFNEMDEFWLKKRFFVPTNYFHQRIIGFTVTGSMATWQVGDTLLANNGVDTGTVDYIGGTFLAVLFPSNPTNDNWTNDNLNGVITNTTRGQTLPCVLEGWPDNNKFHAFWCDAYSNAGAGPTIVFELRASGDGGSVIYFQHGADYQGTGSPTSSLPFISTADFGKWFDWVVHVKMATSETATDGIIEHWMRKEGQSTYTKLQTKTNANIGVRAAGGAAKFRNGYCHGYQNSGYKVDTSLYDSHIILSEHAIDGVV